MRNLEKMCRSWAAAYGDIPRGSIKFIDIHLTSDGAVEVTGRTSCIARHPLFYRKPLTQGTNELYWGMTLEEFASFSQIILDENTEITGKTPRERETSPTIPDQELPDWVMRK
jgi:hypothetical protein